VRRRVASVCGLACKTPLPSPTTQTREGTIALQAGVHYPIRLRVETSTSDRNVQLQWASKSQLRGLVPTAALFPSGPPKNRGAGLNVISFATKQNGTKPDLDKPLASGSTPDVSLAPAVGATGLPLVPVLAARGDAAAGVPAPPVLVSPRLGQHVYGASPEVAVSGIGGVLGGSVLVHVEGTAIDVVLPVGSDGAFSGAIPVGAYGARTLRLTQRNYPGATCTAPPAVFCATSAPVKWDLVVEPAAPPVPPAPVITSPRDPTASPNPANDTFNVTGRATPGLINVCDLGGGSTLTPTVTALPSGAINDVVKLSPGTPGDPNKGWHKLVFSKAACGSPGGSAPVFVSVGIRPPTVEFPRTGATLPCDPNAGSSRFVRVKGRIPYSEAELGHLWVFEETGRSALQLVARDMGVSQTPLPDGTYEFEGGINLTPGKHLVYFFQMPDPPPGASVAERDAHVRGFASIANTPTSRIEIRVPPPALDFPFRGQTFVTTSPFKFGAGNCAAGQTGTPDCALPFADVNVHVGPRVWTVRADGNGNWNHTIDLPPGWHGLTIAQVVDSRSGGGWSESCRSDGTVVGVTTPDDDKNRPTLKLPGNLVVDAQDRRGAKVEYVATATTAKGTAALLECKPGSGATFRIGVTPVFCTAVDPETKAVALGGFTVTVVDGPPVVKVPKGIVAEAESALGALVSWQASASDVVSGDLPVECVPASPALFAVDEQSIVRCAATDASGQTTVESFPVRVQDTTPPTLCPLPDLRILAAGPGGGIVKYETCASDLVDGAVAVSCDRPSGSFFPVGKTLVTCKATDRHKNASPAKQFVVDVGDSTPPVLKLPGTVQVTATSRLGAKVTYAVTATDDTDPKPVVVCEPKSGATFPLGATTVKCTATDEFGNRATGSFIVRVVLAWSDFLSPISPKGTSIFLRPVPVPVRFTLSDGSAGIKDLTPRLFIARIDAAGRVGAEQPAAGLPPALGNAFVYNILLREYDLLLDIHALPAGPLQLRADLGDGVARTVKITLR
jgi:hypothetical protein